MRLHEIEKEPITSEGVINEDDTHLYGKILYHGSNKDFDVYNPTKFGITDQGFLGRGFYLTGDRNLASMYAQGAAENNGGNPVILKFKVYPKKTLELNGTGAAEYREALTSLGIKNSSSPNIQTKELIKLGYDSIAAYYKGMIKEFVALDPTITKRVK